MSGRADINRVLREVYDDINQQRLGNLIAWANPPRGAPIWGDVEPAQVMGSLPPEPVCQPGDRDWEGMDNTRGPEQWDSQPRAANAALGDAWVAQPQVIPLAGIQRQVYPRWGAQEYFVEGLGR